MSDHSELLSDLGGQEDLFEREMRGYSRRRVDEFVARSRSQIRDLEDRLSQALDDNERLRVEVARVRDEAAEKPAHEEISERVGQILRLAEEEAKAQRNRAQDEIAKLRDAAKQETDKQRTDTKQETDKVRAEAQEQAERMLSAAQEQAEHSVATARAEAEKIRNATRAESDRTIAEANKHAENAVATAKAQAKLQLDEATARATAIHDGAERRLNLLMSRHTEAIRRLTEIRDVVTTLVAGENSRGSLEEEVNKAVAGVVGHQPPAKAAGQAGVGAAGPGAAGPGAAGPGSAGQAGTGQSVPGQSVPGQTVPGQSVPGQSVPVQGGTDGRHTAPAQRPAPVQQPRGRTEPEAGARPGEQRGEGQHGNSHGVAEGPARPAAAVPAGRAGNSSPAGSETHRAMAEGARRSSADDADDAPGNLPTIPD